MKHIFWTLFLLAFSAQAYESVMLKHKYDTIFPPGVAGDDWFSKLAYDGHKLKLIKEGSEALNERIKLIQSANRSILLSTFIYDIDESSEQITGNLCLKAKWGVDVRIIVDSVGGRKFYNKEAENLRKCGVGIQLFSPGTWDLLDVVKTMHEKLLIIDGTTVYMGGRGIQNSYHDVKPAHKFYHDVDVVIQGPVACWYQFKFIDNYHKARQENEPCRDSSCRPRSAEYEQYLYGKKDYPACYPINRGHSKVIPLFGNPIFDKSKTPIEDIYIKALENLEMGAKVKLYAPYFVPTKRFGAALIKAKKEKKAQVSVITNSIESNDEGVSILVAMSYEVGYLLDEGIDIRLYPGPMTVHSKIGIFGGKYGHVGSDNLDNRGQHYQTESVIFTDDEQIVKQLEEEFDEHYIRTRPLTKEYIERIRKEPNFFIKIFSESFREYF
jgi:cardiolipin synthase